MSLAGKRRRFTATPFLASPLFVDRASSQPRNYSNAQETINREAWAYRECDIFSSVPAFLFQMPKASIVGHNRHIEVHAVFLHVAYSYSLKRGDGFCAVHGLRLVRVLHDVKFNTITLLLTTTILFPPSSSSALLFIHQRSGSSLWGLSIILDFYSPLSPSVHKPHLRALWLLFYPIATTSITPVVCAAAKAASPLRDLRAKPIFRLACPKSSFSTSHINSVFDTRRGCKICSRSCFLFVTKLLRDE